MTDIEAPGDVPSYSDSFGIYRAEWLSNLFELFTKPAYYPELETARPCVLSGGRGTGKTTVLKCLSYEGRHALSGYDDASVPSWPYYGFYSRINTNRVTAFKGEELPDAAWRRLYAHYLNLVMCGQVVDFLNWYDSKVPNMAQLDAEILTDCVFALRSDPPGQEEYLLRLMKANWPQIEEAYGGSCAPYLTQDRLQALLLSWGVASAIVSAMRTKRSSNLARDYAVGCPSPSTARSS
jgi:hypothetical protein